MGRIKRRHPVKLIIGFIFREETILNSAKGILEKRFGKIDFESKTLPFEHTGYYQKEFARDLLRRFVAFRDLISPVDLPAIKIITNKIENKFLSSQSRLINIDPGYLELSKLVLASTKDYSHRIYLNKGIFAEVTLFYRNKSFHPWDWTYPDYKTPEYIEIFNRIRDIYAKQVKNI